MRRYEFRTRITIMARSEGEARGILGVSQEILLDEQGVVLSIEDGTPIEEEEEEEPDGGSDRVA